MVAAGTAVVTWTGPQAIAATPSPSPDPVDISGALRRHKAEQERVYTGKPSKNGWEMEKVADGGGTIWTRPLPGTALGGVQVRLGDVETALVHVIRRFHYEIDELRRDDLIGWRRPGDVRKGLAESNQASGTAVQIRPGFYPSGQRGGFFANQVVVIRDILADCEGVVRWGGDDPKPDEALFYIDVKPGNEQLTQVANKFRAWTATPGVGAGASADPFQPKRRQTAERLARRQS
nr:M15 family peptidase [Kutzneria buriramensis]WKX09852.1 M15 family peptidase [Kutzneria buriramensis]